MTVRDLAREEVVTAGPDATAVELATQMRDETVGSVLIVDDGLTGVVTDRDLAIEVIAEGTDPSTVTARDVMTADVATVDADAGVFEVTEMMQQESIRRVPVVDNGDLVGILTLDDLTVLLADELGNLASVVEAESPPY